MLEVSTAKVKIDYNKFSKIMLDKAIKIGEKVAKESIDIVVKDAKTKTYKEIADNIETSDVKTVRKQNGATITVSAYVELEKVPYARAVEGGSGIHDPSKRATYPIDAKKAQTLVFWWEKRQKLFVGPHVDHPGVEAKPYLKLALKENKKRIMNLLEARMEGK
jgi:hypothetical protein